MFDFHMHSRVSFDGHDTGEAMAKAALAAGLKEICFTDHLDYDPLEKMGVLAFDTDVYNAEYDHLDVPGLKIRRGMEFGITVDNREQFKKDLQRRPFDFVLGSVHYVRKNGSIFVVDYTADFTVCQEVKRKVSTKILFIFCLSFHCL